MGIRVNRTVNTNDKIEKVIGIFKDIQSCLEDVLSHSDGENKKSMADICSEHGIDYLNLRNLLGTKVLEKIYADKIIDSSDIDLPEMDPYEKLFRAVFKCSNNEVIHFQADFRESVDYIMSQCLNEREQIIIRLRYGFDDSEHNEPVPMTLRELGKMFGLSMERIREIEMKSLRKLRIPKNAKVLRDGLIKLNADEEMRKIEVDRAIQESKEKIEKFKEELNKSNTTVLNMSDIKEIMMNTHINELKLSTRSYNGLIRGNIKNLYDLIIKSDMELSKLRNLGKASLDEIKISFDEYLKGFGTTRNTLRKGLGYDDDEEPLIY